MVSRPKITVHKLLIVSEAVCDFLSPYCSVLERDFDKTKHRFTFIDEEVSCKDCKSETWWD